MNARRTLAAAALLLALAPRPALAQVTAVDQATARALTLEGYEALDRKDYATAADRFARADKLYHVPTVALGLAHAQLGLGKLVAALATYSGIVRDGVPAGGPPAFAKAVSDARHEIEALMPRVPNVVITVKGPTEPTVTIDGVEVPSAALGVKRPVDPGHHIVRAAAKGFEPAEATVNTLEARVENVTLELKPAAAAPPPVVAPGPAAPVPVVAKPEAPPPPAAPQEGRSTQKTLGFVGLGVGGAGLLVGAITGGMALGKHASVVDACPSGHCYASQQKALQSDVDAYHTLGTASTASLIAGGVFVGAGAILVLTAPKAPVTPVIGLGYAGAKGSF